MRPNVIVPKENTQPILVLAVTTGVEGTPLRGACHRVAMAVLDGALLAEARIEPIEISRERQVPLRIGCAQNHTMSHTAQPKKFQHVFGPTCNKAKLGCTRF
jgi:hypothetical protein